VSIKRPGARRNGLEGETQEQRQTYWVTTTLIVGIAVVVVVAVSREAATAEVIDAKTCESGVISVVRILTQGG
jgi:hypothetical protein